MKKIIGIMGPNNATKANLKDAYEIGKYKVIDWGKIDKEEYLLAMERSPIKDIEIKLLLENALTDKINDREVYMKGIDASYKYEGYNTYKLSELK